MIELDGSHGEGGGQILRTALGLSILTQKPFRIINIRKNRPKPGLKAQHVACIKACTELSNAAVDGNSIGSEKIEFIPREIKNRQIEVSIGTAGSMTLLFQSLLLPVMFTECDVKINGGTDVKWSMPIDYIINIIKPVLSNYCGINIQCEKRGYYPTGGGAMSIKTKPKFKRVDFDSFDKFHQYIFGNPAIDLYKSGKLVFVKGISHASIDLQEKQVAERQSQSAELNMKSVCPVNIRGEYANTESTGSGLLLYAVYNKISGNGEDQYRVGVDVLGEQGLRSEEIGRLASEKLKKCIEKDVVVDDCLQDNLIPLLGLFGGKVKVGEITPHTQSNIHVCEKFLGVKYNIENQSDANFISVLSSKTP